MFVTCTHCRRRITDEANFCPRCGRIVEPASPVMSQSGKLIVTGIALLVMILLVMFVIVG